ncbi:dTDP-4-dehydrorhamnose 3,5-epimerase [Persicobacter diffluens]
MKLMDNLLIAEHQLIEPKVNIQDARGKFVKIFTTGTLPEFVIKEIFYSDSDKGVIRGMHFQAPPFAQPKIVTCVSGAILDVIVDLRMSSEAFGKVYAYELNEENGRSLYIPVGFAHGFKGLSEHNKVLYHCSTVYAPDHEGGIDFRSIDFDWGEINPSLVSERDLGFPELINFDSPF